MRILIISGLYPNRQRPTYGIFIHNQVQALQNIGHSCSVIAPVPIVPPAFSLFPRWRKYHRLPHHDVIDGTPITYPRMFRPPGLKFLTLEAYMARATIEHAILSNSNAHPDIIHANLLVPFGYAVARIAHKLNIPLVTTARGDDLNLLNQRSKSYQQMACQALKASAHVVTVSRALAEQAVQLGAQKVTVVRNGINRKFFYKGDKLAAREKLGVERNAHILCYVGWLMWSKGIRELWEIFASLALNDPLLHMFVVGSGAQEGWLREQVRTSSLIERIHLTGTLPQENVGLILRASDIFVFPSHREGMPNAVLEAMAVGLPVVTTRVGGVEDFITDGATGYLVGVGNIMEMQSKIRSLLLSSEKAKFIGKRAEEAVAHLTWEVNAEQMTEIYKEAIAFYGK
ncbi:MAG: glycosyltransferase family 4 protein [Nitrospira sp.]|nr:glycosyltransferase family 4 protein [Nitrospira sp.]